VFGGKAELQIECLAERTVATLDAASFDANGERAGDAAPVEILPFAVAASAGARVTARRNAGVGGIDLSKSDVVVAGGRGLGDADKFSRLIEPLARALGAGVGASRPVVDAGWLPRAHQIGSSGQSVRPSLYVACGISGAVQHLAGIRGAGCVVAINKDRRAPIFCVADIGVVGDVEEILPALTAAVLEKKA
jgi:electron transfer flavoprotein alpha subunit